MIDGRQPDKHPINYKGSLGDLEIVWDNSDAVIERTAASNRISSSRRARSST